MYKNNGNISKKIGIFLKISIFNEIVYEDVINGMIQNVIPQKTGHTIDFIFDGLSFE